MCVAISMEPGTVLTEEEVEKMTRANSDGIGVAWADSGQVHWYKSTAYEPPAAAKFIAERKGFFRLVHFRLATAGGGRVELCHPFEVGPLANCAKQGHSSQVLIHNGHWHRWTDVIDILRKEGALPDLGPWSDSRLGAYLASFDPDWLDAVGGRVALMDGTGDTKLLGSWEQLRPGIKVSNKTWDHSYNYRRSGKDKNWQGWGWSEEEWKQKDAHDAAQAQEAKEKESEAGQGAANGSQKQDSRGQTSTGGGPRDVASARAGHQKGGTQASGGSVQCVGTKPAANGCRGTLSIGGVSKVYRREGELVYSHVPWQNPHSGTYYWIPPESVNGEFYGIESITADRCREILESPAATLVSVVQTK